ncbi:MAG: formylglycine-generating enzyme family protein [Kiritimatiellia bacterium]
MKQTINGMAWLVLAAILVAGGVQGEGLFRVVDLKTGEVVERRDAPADLLANDLYKTTRMVFRRIPAGTVKMDGGRLAVTLTQDYWLGVFECTQAQWETVTGENPSRYPGPHRPVEQVQFEGHSKLGRMVRGGTWPGGDPVDPSFLAKLRALCRGEYRFDLPTEAQWEHACRAGTTTEINSGADLSATLVCPRMAEVARYAGNVADGKGGYTEHATAGSYRPNAWGLYDMHGNVWEWCLDWGYSLPKEAVSDYQGFRGEVGGRVIRGGSWRDSAWFNAADVRNEASHMWTSSSSIGFRVCIQPRQLGAGSGSLGKQEEGL